MSDTEPLVLTRRNLIRAASRGALFAPAALFYGVDFGFAPAALCAFGFLAIALLMWIELRAEGRSKAAHRWAAGQVLVAVPVVTLFAGFQLLYFMNVAGGSVAPTDFLGVWASGGRAFEQVLILVVPVAIPFAVTTYLRLRGRNVLSQFFWSALVFLGATCAFIVPASASFATAWELPIIAIVVAVALAVPFPVLFWLGDVVAKLLGAPRPDYSVVRLVGLPAGLPGAPELNAHPAR
jgi:hypothetical protein